MDFSKVKLEDAAPLMADLETALRDKRVQVVRLTADDESVFTTMSRSHAEVMLEEMEKQFFAKAD